MTVPASTRKAGPYTGNGVTTVFAFTFKVFAKTDVQVVVTDSNGTATTLVLDSGYSMALNIDQDATPGGFITYPLIGSPLPATSTLAMIGAMTADQLLDITNGGRFLPQVVENAFDKATILIQQLVEVSGRTLRAAIGTTVNLVFPAPSSGKFIRWRTDLTGLENAEAGTDSTVLQGLLADNAINTRGGGMIGMNTGLTYPAGTVGSYLKPLVNIPDTSSSANGIALVGYKPTWTGAVGRFLSGKMAEWVSVTDFGVSTANTGAQNNTAIALAIAYIATQGGGTLFFPRGAYNFASRIDITGVSNLRLLGEAIDAVTLFINSATNDLIYSGGTTYYQAIENLSLNSTVTRTASHMMNLGVGGLWKRGFVHRVRIQNHWNGITIPGFEQSTLSEVFIVNPSGAGVSLVAGTAGASNSGANLLVVDCFFRGFNDITQAMPPVGVSGVYAYDIEALFFVNTDIGNYLNTAILLTPTTRLANCYFVQCFFDGTVSGDNLAFGSGTPTFQQIQFTGCWFNGAGNAGAGSNDRFGVNAPSGPTYYDINFTGCRFLSTSGSGFYTSSRYMDFTFSGCVFTNCGFGGGSFKHAMHFQPSGGASLKSPVITGCKFQGSGSKDIRVETNANGVTITGNSFGAGVSLAAGQYLGNVEGNYDPANAGIGVAVTAASTITIPPTCHYVALNGNTNVNRIEPTYPGHVLAMRMTGTPTIVKDGNNLRMPSSFVANGNSVWTAVCEANGEWREIARMTY